MDKLLSRCKRISPRLPMRLRYNRSMHDRPTLPILYRDDDYIAVDKPPGLLVHRTRIADGSEFALQRVRDQIGQRVYPAHRLDRPTSGVLLFALHPEAASALGKLFEARAVEKRYLAVARGYIDAEGVIDYALSEDDKAPQPAVTRYRRLDKVELPIPVGRYQTARYSLVEAVPETGRMHQLRKHFAHVFHPLIGDTTHGEGRHNRLFRERFGVSRLLLLARSLRFAHPNTGVPVEITAPLPVEWKALFSELGWQEPK